MAVIVNEKWIKNGILLHNMKPSEEEYEFEEEEEEEEEEHQYSYWRIEEEVGVEEEEEEHQYSYWWIEEEVEVEEEEEHQYSYWRIEEEVEVEEEEEEHQFDKWIQNCILLQNMKPSEEEEEEEYEYDEEEEKLTVRKVKKGVIVKEIWMNEYSSLHKILLVGEGDFSFSASLAVAFGSATNMIATSLNSEGYLRTNYQRAMSNIQKLVTSGCMVVHGVDATQLSKHDLFKGMKFDRIVFNFPFAGFFPEESRNFEMGRHQNLVGRFMKNAKKMISEDGEIHVRHKCNGFFRDWNLELLGSNHGLELIEEVDFNLWEYPGYRTKYGFAGDNNFNCNPSKTYIFGLPSQLHSICGALSAIEIGWD